MSNSTSNFWAVNGTSLQQFCWNITTYGDKQALPPTRGANLLVPYQTGQTWVSKVPDSRTITLNMWVTGANSDGSIPRNPTQLATFQSNLLALQNLFWNVRGQMTLTKVMQYPDTTTHTVTALAEYAGGFAPQMQGQTAASFSVDLLLADPFFYGPAISQTLATNGSTTFTVVGQDRTENIVVNFAGAYNNLRLQNSTPTAQPYFTYGYACGSGDTVAVDIANFKVTHTVGGNPGQTAGRISHAGDPFWLYLNPGSQTLAASSTSAGSSLSLLYQPRWF